MKIAYIGGFWATNIGNAFYNIGILWLLRNVYGIDNVYFIPDPPQWFWNTKINYDLISKLNVDLVIISGPCFNFKIKKVYEDIFNNLKKKQISVGFVSVGASAYSSNETEYVKKFLNQYDVRFIITRDYETYRLYNEYQCQVYNGLCGSMFLNEALSLPNIEDKYVVYAFDFHNEPYMGNNEKYYVKRKYSILPQKEINGIKIVRCNHTSFSRIKYLIFNKPNQYYSDLPYGYLTIYKNADVILTNRVHACCAGLILGTPAMYIKNSKRSYSSRSHLFERIGVANIFNEPVLLNCDYINSEKNEMIKFMNTACHW